MKKAILTIAMALLCSPSVSAEQAERELMLCAEGTVHELLAADLFKLDSGETVRLMMVQVPRMPQGSETGKPWPMAEQVLVTMKARYTGKKLTFHCGEPARNRHGELVAMGQTADGKWLQYIMVERGWARVHVIPDFSYGTAELYAIEDEARAAHRGLWAYDAYAVRDAGVLDDKVGRFEVVEGRVVDVATVKNVTYFNFGTDWRKDFTLKMDWRARRRFEKAGIMLESFAGKHVQVRGWISWYGGPMIELSHPDQIRVLEE